MTKKIIRNKSDKSGVCLEESAFCQMDGHAQVSANLSKQRVLIVDDKVKNIQLIGSILRENKILFSVAQSGQQAIESALSSVPDMILLDIMMPEMDGYETCQRLKVNQATRDVPIIFLSALTGVEDRVKAFKLGAMDYITKPVRQEELLARVNTHLEIQRYRKFLEDEIRLKTASINERAVELEAVNKQLNNEITERKQAQEKVKESRDTQSIINSLLNLSLDYQPLEDVLQSALELILSIKWLSFEARGCVFLVEPGGNILVMKSQKGLNRELLSMCSNVEFGRCICGQAAKTGTVMFTDCIDERHEIIYEGMVPHGHYCVPILSGDVVLGVLNIYVQEGHKYNKGEEEVLVMIANTLSGIIERKKMEEEKELIKTQLVQTQKMEAIGTLAGGIAHDFNNILVPILGYAELVSMSIDKDDPVAGYMDEISRASLRAKELVRQILSFSRQSDQQHHPVQVQLIVKEVLKLIRSSIPASIEIIQNVNSDCGFVLADPIHIHQFIMNLCTNAYHAMRENGGVLTISLSPIDLGVADVKVSRLDLAPGSYVKLEVSDTGHGMSRSTRERIFEPYFTTKKKGEGTGLGLSLVHGIVKNIGGYVEVFSELAEGTTFSIYMPMSVTNGSKQDVFNKKMIPKGNENILLVDDEEAIIKMTQEILQELGYTVNSFTSSASALSAFQDNPGQFDLVITDMTMPMMSGADLAGKLLAIKPGIPIILFTGFSDLINEEKAKAIGIEEYIMKPIVLKDLAVSVRRAIDGKRN